MNIVDLIKIRKVFANRLGELTYQLLNDQKQCFKPRHAKKVRVKAGYCREICDDLRAQINEMGFIPDVDETGSPIRLDDPRIQPRGDLNG
jgi:hypothetical protein